MTPIVVGLVATVAACSSGSSAGSPIPSTSTHSTSRPIPSTNGYDIGDVGALRAFFAGEGEVLLRFERATEVVANGHAPDPATCQRLTSDTLPAVTEDPNDLLVVANKIPRGSLASAFQSAVALKLILILGCTTGRTPPTGSDADPGAYTSIQDASARVAHLLRSIGIVT